MSTKLAFGKTTLYESTWMIFKPMIKTIKTNAKLDTQEGRDISAAAQDLIDKVEASIKALNRAFS